MTGSKSEAELWLSLQQVDEDVLADDYPMELIDEELRAAGADPVACAEKGRAIAAQAMRRRRLAWQDEARARIAEMKRAGSRQLRLDLSGAALRQALERAASHPAVAAAAFRKRSHDKMSDDELRELLADLEDVIARSGGTDGSSEE